MIFCKKDELPLTENRDTSQLEILKSMIDQGFLLYLQMLENCQDPRLIEVSSLSCDTLQNQRLNGFAQVSPS